MTPILTTALVTHIILGIAAIGLAHLVFMQLLRKAPAWNWAVTLATWSTFLFFVSWASSAYYYVVYYGKVVKPVITAGEYQWAHTVFMEGKEHVFLILPFMALALTMGLVFLRKNQNTQLQKSLAALAATLVILGLFVALAGVAVSGAAR
jgi:hypothetical protein